MKTLCVMLFLFNSIILTEGNYEETGKASYYSSTLEGRRTSSGEKFSQKLLTAAHKTLAFGTYLKVTNLTNDSIVIVKVNDRLGKKAKSIIDLSLAAAKQLNFVRNGYAKVKLEKVESK
jgi:rare lipoprotein A